MVELEITEKDVLKALREVVDPEIPVLSVVDMNIIRSVEIAGDEVTVGITPTFVGCPALDTIATSIKTRLEALGFTTVRVEKNFLAPWSSDQLGDPARRKLEQFGVAPPVRTTESGIGAPTACPFCHSHDTRNESPFGATLCKQLFYCNSCKQSFERFRTI